MSSLPINDWISIPAEDLRFETMRAGGPGGQHVNTTDSRVRLRFNLAGCAVLSEPVKTRLRERFPSKLTDEGEFVVVCDEHRSQLRNLETARERLAAFIRQALVPPKRRYATKPSYGATLDRLGEKKKRGDTKKTRGKVWDPD
jgi:ribosome-associated protein